MKEYFLLQFKLGNRHLSSIGINPVIAYPLGILAFIKLSNYLFERLDFASYLLLLSCFSLELKLSEKNRSEFLKLSFGDKQKTKIRLLENLLLSLPFVGMLLYQNHLLEAVLLIGISSVLALLSFGQGFNYTIPSPFYKQPFEFSIGFRKTLVIFLLAYGIGALSISALNLNLGIFSMFIVFLICLSFYSTPEPDYYVWIHHHSPREFLGMKIRIALRNSAFMAAPILIGLFIAFPADYEFTALMFSAGLGFVVATLLAKYSTYPEKMNIPEGVIFALCLYFPPLLIVVLPYLYYKAVQKLKTYLHD